MNASLLHRIQSLLEHDVKARRLKMQIYNGEWSLREDDNVDLHVSYVDCKQPGEDHEAQPDPN
jgi:hypothetical protein